MQAALWHPSIIAAPRALRSIKGKLPSGEGSSEARIYTIGLALINLGLPLLLYGAAGIGLSNFTMHSIASSAFVLPVAGKLMDRFGHKRVSLVGGTLLTLTTVAFLSSAPPVFGVVVVLLIARGAGLALAQMPAIAAAYGEVDKTKTGDAATLINIARRLGGAVGAIAVVAVIEQVGISASGAASRAAFAMLVILSAGALFAATRIAVPKQEQ